MAIGEEDLLRLRARLEERLGSISGALSEYKEREKAADARNTEIAEKREKAARSGELGADWQRVQQRIDLGQTTITDVFSGQDDSPEARALLGNSQKYMADLARSMEEDAEESDEETPLEEAQRLRASFEERAAQFRRMNLEDLA